MRDTVSGPASCISESVRTLMIIGGVWVWQQNGWQSGASEFRERCRASPRHDEGRRSVSSGQIIEECLHESVWRQRGMSGPHRVELTRSRLMNDAPTGTCIADETQRIDHRFVERIGSLTATQHQQFSRRGRSRCERGGKLGDLTTDRVAGGA